MMAFHNNTSEDITITDNSGDLSLDIDDSLVDLFDNCSSLNFEPFTFTDNKGYFVTDEADPDEHFYKHMSTNSLYYTEEQFKHKLNTNLLSQKKTVPTFL